MEDVSTTGQPTLPNKEKSTNTSKYFKDFKTPMFATFEFQILLDIRLNSTDKIVYAVVNACTNNKDKICYATNYYIARCINSDISTVKRSITRLIKYNYVIKFIKNNNKRYLKTTIAKFIEDRGNNSEEFFANIDLDDEYDWLSELD